MDAETELAELADAYNAVAASLADTGWVAQGSVALRANKCGKPNCACKADPPRPHGPYWQWTTKRAGKTVNRRLTPDQARMWTQWTRNDQRLRAAIAEMRRLSTQAITIIEQQQTPTPTNPQV